MLLDLTTGLNISPDAMLEIKPVKNVLVRSRLVSRIRQIEKLGAKHRQQITQLIDTFFEAEQLILKADVN